MASINPYLHFNGNAEEAFTFYKSVFGGEFALIQRFKEVPTEFAMPSHEGQKIMHVALPIGNGNVLMGSDVPEKFGQVKVGSNFSISISTQSKKETDILFKALSEGGTITMALADTFWGAYFGMLTDRFGINWMVSFDSNYQS